MTSISKDHLAGVLSWWGVKLQLNSLINHSNSLTSLFPLNPKPNIPPPHKQKTYKPSQVQVSSQVLIINLLEELPTTNLTKTSLQKRHTSLSHLSNKTPQKMSSQDQGRESPDPERQSGKQATEPPSDGQGVNNSSNAESNKDRSKADLEVSLHSHGNLIPSNPNERIQQLFFRVY